MKKLPGSNPEKDYAIHYFDGIHLSVPRNLANSVAQRIAQVRRCNPDVMLGVSAHDVAESIGCIALDPDSNVVGYVRSKGWRAGIEDDRQVTVEEIGSLYVHPYFRGNGMAKQLIADMCLRVEQTGIADRLEARCRNWPSRQAFEANGFEYLATDAGVMVMTRQLTNLSMRLQAGNEAIEAA